MNAANRDQHEPVLPADAKGVGLVVAQLADMRLPLGEGLLAAAREVGSRRMSRALSRLGSAIQRGSSLAVALESCRGLVPPHLAAALAAAEKSGQLGPVLAEWTENQLAAQARSRQLSQALAYPLVCVVSTVLLLLLIGWHVIPAFEQMFREFELPIPRQTVMVLWMGRFAFPIAIVTAGAIAGLVLLVPLAGGRLAWCWCVSHIPLLGRLWHWSGVAESLRVLAILVEHQKPLPEALRLTGQSTRDAFMGRSLLKLAQRTESGATLSGSLEDDGRLPRSLAPLLRAAERNGSLASGIRDGAAMLEQRITAQCDLISTVVPPLFFVGIGFVLLIVIGSLFGPLLQLIEGLSQ